MHFRTCVMHIQHWWVSNQPTTSGVAVTQTTPGLMKRARNTVGDASTSKSTKTPKQNTSKTPSKKIPKKNRKKNPKKNSKKRRAGVLDRLDSALVDTGVSKKRRSNRRKVSSRR